MESEASSPLAGCSMSWLHMFLILPLGPQYFLILHEKKLKKEKRKKKTGAFRSHLILCAWMERFSARILE